jgi:hypothetical protein
VIFGYHVELADFISDQHHESGDRVSAADNPCFAGGERHFRDLGAHVLAAVHAAKGRRRLRPRGKIHPPNLTRISGKGSLEGKLH